MAVLHVPPWRAENKKTRKETWSIVTQCVHKTWVKGYPHLPVPEFPGCPDGTQKSKNHRHTSVGALSRLHTIDTLCVHVEKRRRDWPVSLSTLFPSCFALSRICISGDVSRGAPHRAKRAASEKIPPRSGNNSLLCWKRSAERYWQIELFLRESAIRRGVQEKPGFSPYDTLHRSRLYSSHSFPLQSLRQWIA